MDDQEQRQPTERMDYAADADLEYCSVGGLRKGPAHLDSEIYTARVKNSDARKALALCMSRSDASPFQKLRSLLSRGHIREAETLASLLQSEKAVSQADRTELLLESARIHAFNGEWEQSLRVCNEALASEPTGLSRQTLHQVRALCLFEFGEFRLALKDCETVNDLSRLYPYSVSIFYNEANRIRCISRTQGIATARREVERLWQGALDGEGPTCDQLLTLLRLEIDLRRISFEDYLDVAFASYQLANRLGDRLYAALALLDIYYAGHSKISAQVSSELDEFAAEFPRVARLKGESARQLTPVSVTAKTVHDYLSHFDSKSTGSRDVMDLEFVQRIFIVNRKITIGLSPFKVEQAEYQKSIGTALLRLAAGPVERSEFFSTFWGIKNFVPELHDNVVRTLLTRVRKQAGADVEVSTGVITLKNSLVIEC